MIQRVHFFIVVILLTGAVASGQESLTKEQILQDILHKAEQNEKLAENYGFAFENTDRKLTENGAVKKEETRSYRIVWVQGEPYSQLKEVNGKPLDDKQKKEEQKRLRDFEKKLKEKKKDPEEEEFEWKDLYEKYDFTRLEPRDGSAYTIAFQPKSKGLRERNRTEKVLNHLKGMLWADEAFNLIKVKASLESPVRFGFGIIAKIEKLEIEYSQRPFEDVYMPSIIRYDFAGRLALFRSERQEHVTEFSEFYHRE